MRRVPAVSAAIGILRRLDAQAEGLGVSQLARDCRLSKSSVHAIVKTLEAEEFVIEIGDSRRYRLGAALVELGESAREPKAAMAIARPHLDALARRLGLACFFAVPYDENEFLIVEKAESSRAVKVTVSVGERFPLTAGALGKAYLAWKPAPEALGIIRRLKLPARTGSSITRVKTYLAELVKVRTRGFAEVYGEYDPATNAVAAPVFDAAGRIILLFLTVGFPSTLPPEAMQRHGRTLREVADQVTVAVGGRYPTLGGSPTKGQRRRAVLARRAAG